VNTSEADHSRIDVDAFSGAAEGQLLIATVENLELLLTVQESLRYKNLVCTHEI
jgi:hypothetical protein